MAYSIATREDIIRNPAEVPGAEVFRNTVAGTLWRHARYLFDTGTTEGGEQTAVISIIANVNPFVVPTMRAILLHPAQDGLSDVTALTDEQVSVAIQTVWPMLVAAWRGTV